MTGYKQIVCLRKKYLIEILYRTGSRQIFSMGIHERNFVWLRLKFDFFFYFSYHRQHSNI